MERDNNTAATAGAAPVLTVPTLFDALTRYRREVTPKKKGARQEHNRIGQLLGHPLAQMPLGEVRGHHLARYRDERLGERLSPTTVRNELIVLSHLYTIARTEWGHEGLQNPAANIRKPKLPAGRTRRLMPGEESRLLRAARGEIRDIIPFAIETGMRRSEIARMTWGNVDGANGIVLLPDTKNGEARTVPLSPRAIDILRKRPRDRAGVFTLTPDLITRAFGDACQRAGIEGLRFHDLRHEATSRLFERGFDVMEVSSITGHKTLAMLKRYTHLGAVRLVQKLAATAAAACLLLSLSLSLSLTPRPALADEAAPHEPSPDQCAFKEFCDGSPWPKPIGWSLQLDGHSWHSRPGYNENNRGLGLEYELQYETFVEKFALGSFINSMNDRSWHVGGVWQKRAEIAGIQFDAGFYAGLLTYPSYNGNSPFPVILPAASIGTHVFGVNLLLVPSYQEIPATVFLQLRIGL